MVDNATSGIREDTTYGYAGPGDSPAYIYPTSTGPSGAVTTYIGSLRDSNGTPAWTLATLHSDVAGTVDATGIMSIAPETDEYGNGSKIDPSRLGYLGTRQRYTTDTQLRLIRMGIRLYDPDLGRFLQMDPIEGGSANSYEYGNADPENEFDIDGRRSTRQNLEWGAALSWYCFKHLSPRKCHKAYTLGKQAVGTASKYFPVGTKEWDAMKHVLWHALMVSSGMGKSWAHGFGVAYEHYSNNKDGSSDISNNNLGDDIGYWKFDSQQDMIMRIYMIVLYRWNGVVVGSNCNSCPYEPR